MTATPVSVRVDQNILEYVDTQVRCNNFVSRSDGLRHLIREGFDSRLHKLAEATGVRVVMGVSPQKLDDDNGETTLPRTIPASPQQAREGFSG